MGKNSKIRYGNSDEKSLKRAVNNFNAKRRRLVTKDPENANVYPERVSLKELRNTIKQGTRQDLNFEVKSLKNFTVRGVEKIKDFDLGLKITEYELKDTQKRVQAINRQRAKEKTLYNKTQATSRGQQIEQKRAEMGTVQGNAFNKKKFDPNKIKKRAEWEEFKKSVKKQSRTQYYNMQRGELKEHYIQGLTGVFGDNASPIIKKIRGMSSAQFYARFMSDTEATFEFFYDDPLAGEQKLSVLGKVWNVSEQDQLKFDLEAGAGMSDMFEEFDE